MSHEADRAVSALAGTRKAVKLYPASHPRFGEAVEALVEAVRCCTAGGPFVINLHQGRLYFGSDIVGDEVPGALSVAEALEARRVESLCLHPGFGPSDAVGLVEVLSLRPSPELDPEAELAQRGVSNVSIAYLADEEADERAERDRVREQDRALYRQLVGVLQSLASKLSSGESPSLTEASSLVGSILGRLMEDQAAVLGMATLQGGGEADLYHGMNVMIYTLALGSELGLPDEGLGSLGVCALLHDIGKARFHAEGADQDTVWLLHPSAGAEMLSRIGLDDPGPMLVAYEHHMGTDGTGHPERPQEYIAHPYSRMVAVADRYETLTREGVTGTPLTPDRAVMQLLAEAGRPLDPLLTSLFVRAMGVFPIGCVVRLSDMRVGVVCAAGEGPLVPKVRVLYDARGLELADPEDVPASNGSSIVEVIDPDALELIVADKL